MKLRSTIVFQKNWNAIHARNPDGTRKYRYIINRGSSRSSKTMSLIDCYDLYARINDNKRLTVWRDTKTDCKKTVLNDALKHFKRTGRYCSGQEFNKTESIFTYGTGCTFEIHGTDDEEAVHGLNQAAAWLNEPYKISKETFDQIDQRTEDFIVLDINPKKAHWSDDLEKDPRAIVIHSTFKDNPFCPEEQRNKILSYQTIAQCELVQQKLLTESEAKQYDLLLNPKQVPNKFINELRRCRENEEKKSANAFNWDVYGLGAKAERPNRIFKWHEIPEAVYRSIDSKIYVGVDWGVVDPWGIVEAKYYDGALYLHERNYLSETEIRSKLTLTELAQISGDDEGIVRFMFGKLGIEKKWEIVCDDNRPLKIAMLRRSGWAYCYPALKVKGSVLDGIDLLNNINVYFTSSSTNLKYEQENYSRKVDRYGAVLEEPEDMDNHCFIANTLIATPTGHKKIIDLKEGDDVFTQFGVHKIVKKFSNGCKEVCSFIITFDNNENQQITCTPNHKIYTKEKGWLPIALLQPGMTITRFKSSTEKSITSIKGKNIIQKDVEQNLSSINTQGQERVVKHVQMSKSSSQDVYDLMIEDDHSFFADNILVHNCMDPARYISLYLQSRGIIKRL